MFHFLYSLLEIAKYYFLDIDPTLFKEAVHKETDRLYTHVTHHHLVGPLVYYRLQIDVVLMHLT